MTICEGHPVATRQEILTKIKGMHGVLWAGHERLDAEALDAAGPQLKSISTMSAGIDYVDLAEVRRRGIPIGYTPSVLNDAVADVAIGLMVAACRRFHEGLLKIEQNDWETGPQWMLGQDIKGRTVGIVGLGEIGQTIAKRLQGFEIQKLLYTGHKPKAAGDRLNATFVSFDELLANSDIVFVATPLTNETKGMFNEAAFNKMKPTSVFVNIARGAIVDQDALINALKTNKIFAAGLDVMSPEPLPADHPLLKLPNCVVIPHLGSATVRTRNDMATLAAHNVLRGIAGEPMLSPVP